MPQARNKVLLQAQDSTSFGANSRFIAVVKQSEKMERRAQMANAIEKRMSRMKLKVIERHADILERRLERVCLRTNQSLKKILAYRKVVNENTSYSTESRSFRFQVEKAIAEMDDMKIKNDKTKKLLEMSKEEQSVCLKKGMAFLKRRPESNLLAKRELAHLTRPFFRRNLGLQEDFLSST
ncbi:unnamed protein product [Dimorphilus gyrociliatus]|uniref:Uncharacterized protein n=1 Tax=Dimorphilus gyrociliatus TaxID=2664684 RepID=A0A7I8VSW5_9ANNE|nr:unnamed protein product [Dimorphilus gyrociliatus]